MTGPAMEPAAYLIDSGNRAGTGGEELLLVLKVGSWRGCFGGLSQSGFRCALLGAHHHCHARLFAPGWRDGAGIEENTEL